jgi:hypothetical protein
MMMGSPASSSWENYRAEGEHVRITASFLK